MAGGLGGRSTSSKIKVKIKANVPSTNTKVIATPEVKAPTTIKF